MEDDCLDTGWILRRRERQRERFIDNQIDD